MTADPQLGQKISTTVAIVPSFVCPGVKLQVTETCNVRQVMLNVTYDGREIK